MTDEDIPSHRLFGEGSPEPGDEAAPEVPGYAAVRMIGQGASASVWLVQQERPFARLVAMKVFRAARDGSMILDRFRAERDILARLPSSRFCALYDAGLCADGRPFICMEYVDGTNMLDACSAPGMDAPRIGALFLELLRTVAQAHDLGLIHLDLKPSNVLVVPSAATGTASVPKVIDFGLSVREGTPSRGTGTRGYAAPELAEGRIATKSADVYSIAAMLARALQGAKDVEASPLGRRLAGLARSQCSSEPAARAPDAGAFGDLLADELTRGTGGRRRALMLATGAIVAAAAGGIGALRLLGRGHGTRTQRVGRWLCIDMLASYNATRSMLHEGDRLPWGLQRIDGVPFLLGIDPASDARIGPLCVWSASVGHGENPRILVVPAPADEPGDVRTVALLLSTLWGLAGGELLHVDLVSTTGRTHTTTLRGGRDVRDYRGGPLGGGTTTRPGTEYADGQWLDVQRVDVPGGPSFGRLASVQVRDEGKGGVSRGLCFGCSFEFAEGG